MISTLTLKFVITAAIFVSALLSVLAPLAVISQSETFFSVGNMMASGVLLAAALTHQLADASSALNTEDGYPWAMFIAGTTFILFLILEESVHLLMGESSHDHDGGGGGLDILTHAHSHGHNEHGHKEDAHNGSNNKGHDHSHEHGNACTHTEETPLMETPKTNQQHQKQQQHQQVGRRRPSCSSSMANHAADHVGRQRSIRLYSKTGTLHFADTFTALEVSELDDGRSSGGGSSRSPRRKTMGESSMLASIIEYDPTYSAHHHHDGHIEEHLHGSALASIMLFVALSLHSILEGVSIGISPSTDVVVATSAAILAHKAFAGYALGSTMITAEEVSTEKHLTLGVIFSCTTPIGVLIGMILLNGFDEDGPAVGVVQAMVAGTFLYVSIVEVGMKELLICRHGENDFELSKSIIGKLNIKQLEFLKLSFFLFGFLAMSGLAFFV